MKRFYVFLQKLGAFVDQHLLPFDPSLTGEGFILSIFENPKIDCRACVPDPSHAIAGEDQMSHFKLLKGCGDVCSRTSGMV